MSALTSNYLHFLYGNFAYSMRRGFIEFFEDIPSQRELLAVDPQFPKPNPQFFTERTICILSIPCFMIPHEILHFFSSYLHSIVSIEILRNFELPDQYIAILKLDTVESATNIMTEFHGTLLSSLQPMTCFMYPVKDIHYHGPSSSDHANLSFSKQSNSSISCIDENNFFINNGMKHSELDILNTSNNGKNTKNNNNSNSVTNDPFASAHHPDSIITNNNTIYTPPTSISHANKHSEVLQDNTFISSSDMDQSGTGGTGVTGGSRNSNAISQTVDNVDNVDVGDMVHSSTTAYTSSGDNIKLSTPSAEMIESNHISIADEFNRIPTMTMSSVPMSATLTPQSSHLSNLCLNEDRICPVCLEPITSYLTPPILSSTTTTSNSSAPSDTSTSGNMPGGGNDGISMSTAWSSYSTFTTCCQHTFHVDCMLRMEGMQCPVCRYVL